MIYDYKCSDCESVHEVWAKLSDPPLAACPKCGSAKVAKLISAPAFALKGTGWYTTDYKRAAAPKEGEKTGEKPAEKAACGAGACGAPACEKPTA